jgi:hypothetical protein
MEVIPSKEVFSSTSFLFIINGLGKKKVKLRGGP